MDESAPDRYMIRLVSIVLQACAVPVQACGFLGGGGPAILFRQYRLLVRDFSLSGSPSGLQEKQYIIG